MKGMIVMKRDDYIPFSESVRRYGMATLSATAPEDKERECQDRIHYYRVKCKAFEKRLEGTDPLSDEFDEIYAAYEDVYRLWHSYVNAWHLLIWRKMQPPKR